MHNEGWSILDRYLTTGKNDLRKGIDGSVSVIAEQFDLDIY